LITACGKYCKKLYKTCITDLELSTTPLTDGCHNNDVIQLVPLRSQSLFEFAQISDAYFLHLLLRYFSHAVINWIQIWRIWRPQLRWDKFWSFFLCQLSGSTCAMSISSFTRQWTDIVQVRWKTLTSFIANLFRKPCIKFH